MSEVLSSRVNNKICCVVIIRAFDTHISGVLERLDGRLRGLEDTRLKHIEVVMANHGLVDASFQQLILLCHAISPALGDIMKTVRGYHSAFMSDLQRTAGQFLEDVRNSQAKESQLLTELDNSEGEVLKLMEVADLLDKVRSNPSAQAVYDSTSFSFISIGS